MRMPTKVRETAMSRGAVKMGKWGLSSVPAGKIKTAPTVKLKSKLKVW
jgi:hypothetical protein